MIPKLEACPFCGGPAEIHKPRTSLKRCFDEKYLPRDAVIDRRCRDGDILYSIPRYVPRCCRSDCPGRLGKGYQTPEDAARAWNRRPGDETGGPGMKPNYVVKLPPVTKKNHQQILRGKGGRPYVAPSPQYKQYARDASWFLRPFPLRPIDYRVNIRCLFYLPTRRKTDLTNLLESIDDVMVDCGILADDNYLIVAGHDGSRCYVDRENPRTEIYIERMEDL